MSVSDAVDFVEDLKLGIAGIFEDANESIVVVCPFVRLDEVGQLATRLIAALARGVEVTLIVRDERRQRDETLGKFQKDLVRQGLNFLVVRNLHAKIYMSEARVIVSSVNLLESSFQHGLEVGLAAAPGPIYERLRKFIELTLLDRAEVIFGTSPAFRRRV